MTLELIISQQQTQITGNPECDNIQNVPWIQANIQFLNTIKGVGISNIEKTSTVGIVDTYTITYTDGTTSTFDVTNGIVGADGRGIVSFELIDTQEKTKTYRMLFTDANYVDIAIIDGNDGVDGLTPYIGINGNWWIGDVDQNIKAEGVDGISPTIGLNGNWYLGTTDTGVKAQATGAYEIYLAGGGTLSEAEFNESITNIPTHIEDATKHIDTTTAEFSGTIDETNDKITIWDNSLLKWIRFSFTNLKSYLKTYFDTLYPTKTQLINVDNKITDIVLDNTNFYNEFDGISSSLSCSDIIISQIGDYIEFDLQVETTNQNTGYSFSGRSLSTANTSIGISTAGVTVRDINNNWIMLSGLVSLTTNRLLIKIERGVDGVNLYYDGVLKKTSPFISNILIQRFGDSYSSNYGFWKGKIYSIKVNTSTIQGQYLPMYLPNAIVNSGITLTSNPYGFLTIDQYEDLEYANTQIDIIDLHLNAIDTPILKLITGVTGNKAYTTLPSSYYIDSVGDYFELNVRNTQVSNTTNIRMGIGEKTRFGFYLNKYYFRSNSNSGSDYRIWDLPSGHDITKFHNYRIEVVLDESEKKWELFIDNVSAGTKSYSINANINMLMENLNTTGSTCEYDYIYLKINQSNVITTLTAKDLYTLSTNGIFSSYATLKGLDDKINNVEDNLSLILKNPNTFISWNKDTKYFNIYLKDKNNESVYYGFKLYLNSSRGTLLDELTYSYHWEIVGTSYLNIYNSFNNTMIPTTTTLITAGESECVIRYTDTNGSKHDFTGGFHGDETIDIDENSFVTFYVDGIPILESELTASFDLLPCNEFKYIQKSSMHDTAYYETNVDTLLPSSGDGIISLKSDTMTFAIDMVDTSIPAYYSSTQAIIDGGVTVNGSGGTWVLNKVLTVYLDHPIIATHIKKTEFKDNGYITENTLIFNTNRTVELWYHGICSLGKGVATSGHNSNYVEQEFTGSKLNYLTIDKYDLFEAYNSTTGCSAIINSAIVDGGTNVIDNNSCEMFIWDRVNDSKYYRNTGSFIPIANERLTSIMKVQYKNKIL